jgi:tetratricopeptide (TPR) repeat protein
MIPPTCQPLSAPVTRIYPLAISVGLVGLLLLSVSASATAGAAVPALYGSAQVHRGAAPSSQGAIGAVGACSTQISSSTCAIQATAALKQGDITTALHQFDQAIRRAETPAQLSQLVHTLHGLRVWRLANQAGDTMAQRYPALAPAWQAWQAEHLSPLPSGAEELARLARIYQQGDTLAAAQEGVLSGVVRPKTATLPAEYQPLQALLRQRRPDVVLARLARQPQAVRRSPWGQWITAQALWYQQTPQPAAAAFQQALTAAETTLTPQAQQAFYRHVVDTCLAEGWLPAAQAVLADHPRVFTVTESQPYEVAGRLALQTDDPAQAQALLGQAAFLNPTQPRIARALALVDKASSAGMPATGQPIGFSVISSAQAALSPPVVPTPNQASYFQYLMGQEARYQMVVSTFYGALPGQLAQPSVPARYRYVGQGVATLRQVVNALASGFVPPDSASERTRQVVLAKAYRQLAFWQQLAQNPSLGPDTLGQPQYSKALKEQADMEAAVLKRLPTLTGLPPMTYVGWSQTTGLAAWGQTGSAGAIAALIPPPPQPKQGRRPKPQLPQKAEATPLLAQ